MPLALALAAHVVFGVLGTLCTAGAIYAALTGNPSAAAIAGGAAFFCAYPSKPH